MKTKIKGVYAVPCSKCGSPIGVACIAKSSGNYLDYFRSHRERFIPSDKQERTGQS